MAWDVRIEKEAQKELDKIPYSYREKIIAVLSHLSSNPYIGKKLSGKLKNLYTYRVWPYRIIYKLYKKQLLIIIIHVAHRQGVYKKVYKK